jgi:GMP synthase (glutamine-hydrolysing)
MDRRAVVVIHAEAEGPGLLEAALRRAGFEPVQRFRTLEPDDCSAPLLVSMGGPMAAYDAQRLPYLRDEIAALRTRLFEDRPTLGICLGAQLLAAAAGAAVRPGVAGLELGAFPVWLTPAASSDPAFASVPTGTYFAHWHQDEFEPVRGAERLAFTERYSQQAFKLGACYGIQFHPELDATMFREWLLGSPQEVERSGRTLAEILDADLPRFQASQRISEALLRQLARYFAERCFAPFTPPAL